MAKRLPLMSWKQLIALARRRAIVQWFPSGRIETLRLAVSTSRGRRKGEVVILAKGLLENHERPLLRERKYVYCREVPPDTPIPVGQLFKHR